jgi:uncharacterized repeat protein (TIGR03803 family)
MMKLSGLKKACTVFALCAATTIAGRAQDFDTLFRFDGPNGDLPQSSLIQGRDGNLYGTTTAGGGCEIFSLGCGTIFKITPSGTFSTLYTFCPVIVIGCPDGSSPVGGLILANDGSLYGTTEGGGFVGSLCSPTGCGTIFKITPEGTLTTLHRFVFTDGQDLHAGLFRASDRNFYGTTRSGGTYGYGTVFRMTPTGTLTTLYSFCAQPSCPDGGVPQASLVQATNGDLYGTTWEYGSAYGHGTVFKITLQGRLTTMHVFHVIDGAQPFDALIQGTDGNLYGTTSSGGHSGNGTVFTITLGGEFATLHDFCIHPHCTDGFAPFSALIQATDGNFYGTTAGTIYHEGAATVFRMSPSGMLTTLQYFDGANGDAPYGGLVQATTGKFFGTTTRGGYYSVKVCQGIGCGTVFSGDTGLGPFVAFVHAAGEVGQTGGILGQGFTGASDVSLNGTPADFTVVSDTFIRATVPAGATTGYVTVTTPGGTLTSNVPFRVTQ